MKVRPQSLDFFIRLCFAALGVGIIGGGAASLFLHLLKITTEFRQSHSEMIWFLPLGGFFIGWLYHYYGARLQNGMSLIRQELSVSQNKIPWQMAPLVLIGTLLTHLFGGSAGREGTAVQMAVALSDNIRDRLKVDRKILLAMGISAGFSAAIGAPLAGMVFGLEFLNSRKFLLKAFVPLLLASWVSLYITLLLQTPHSVFPAVSFPQWAWVNLFYVAVAGVAFGLAAKFFMVILDFISRIMWDMISYPPLRPLVGGCLLVFLYWLEGSYLYVGLGLETIQQSFTQASGFLLPLWKILFTALTLGVDFKGGEFIPLVFVGTTLGSALTYFLPLSTSLLAGVGFGAVYGAVMRTPGACVVMLVEIFGIEMGLYAAIACGVSYYCSRR